MLGTLAAGLQYKRTGFKPTDIAGCKLWLRGDMGVTQSGGVVSNWADQSGNGNDCAAAGALQPVFNASSIGGQPGLTFAGGTSAPTYLTGSTNLIPSGNSPRTAFVVLQAASGAGGTPLTFRVAGSNLHCQLLYIGSTLYWMGDQSTNTQVNGVNPIAINGVGAVAEWGVSGPSSLPLCTFNGTPYTCIGNVSSDLASGTTGFSVGNRNDISTAFGQAWGGEIDEVIVYDTLLGSTDENTVYQYLKARYGL